MKLQLRVQTKTKTKTLQKSQLFRKVAVDAGNETMTLPHVKRTCQRSSVSNVGTRVTLGRTVKSKMPKQTKPKIPLRPLQRRKEREHHHKTRARV